MSYMRPRKPRFYVDHLMHLHLSGVDSSSIVTLDQGTLNTGFSVLDLISGDAQAGASFDTSAHTSTTVLVPIDLQDTSQTCTALAVLCHNLGTACGMVKLYHYTSPITHSNLGLATQISLTAVVGLDGEGSLTTDGDWLFTFTSPGLRRYFCLAFESLSTWSATDLYVGQVILGNSWTAPLGLDEKTWEIEYQDGVKIDESPAGKRRALVSWRHGSEGQTLPLGVPFRAGASVTSAHKRHTGRRVVSFSLGMIDDSDLRPSDMSDPVGALATLKDVLTRTSGAALPCIFVPDSVSTTRGDHMWARIMAAPAAAPNYSRVFTQKLRIEEEF